MKNSRPREAVVDYNVKIRVKADGSGVELANIEMSMNPFDEIAVKEAIRLKEAGKATEIVAVSIGRASSDVSADPESQGAVPCNHSAAAAALRIQTAGGLELIFDLTEEQKLFAKSVRRFAEANLAKDALKRAHTPGFPLDVASLMAQQGLLGITIPVEDGGQGGSLMDAVIAIEQVASVCPRSADVVQAGNFGPIRTFAEYATSEQKSRFMGDLLNGEIRHQPRYDRTRSWIGGH